MRANLGAITLTLCLLLCPAAAWGGDCPRPEPPVGHTLYAALYRAQKEQVRKHTTQAYAELKRFARENPSQAHYRLYYTLGVLAFELGRASEAGRHFARATQLYSCYAPAWQNLAVVRFRQKRYREAAEMMLKAHALTRPPNPELLYQAAAMFLTAGDARSALPLLERLAGRPKPRASWLKALVQTCLLLKRTQRAATVLERLLRMQPGEAVLWRLAASVALEQCRYATAAADLEIAYALEPPRPEGWRRLGDIYRAAGVPAQAAVCYRRACGDKPTPRDLDRLALVLARAHRLEEAIRAARQAAEAKPTAWRWGRLGRLYLLARRYPQARDAFRRAARLDPARGRHSLMAAYADMQLGDYPAARRDLTRALRTAKKDSSTAREAARLLKAVERYLREG